MEGTRVEEGKKFVPLFSSRASISFLVHAFPTHAPYYSSACYGWAGQYYLLGIVVVSFLLADNMKYETKLQCNPNMINTLRLPAVLDPSPERYFINYASKNEKGVSFCTILFKIRVCHIVVVL